MNGFHLVSLLRMGLAPALVLFFALPVVALPPQPTFSVDFQGPTVTTPVLDSFTGTGITDADILSGPVGGPPLGAPGPGPLPPPGLIVPGGAVAGGLGILTATPTGFTELDALSYGRDLIDVPARIYFSVDEWAIGFPGGPAAPDVFTEGAIGTMEASADVFIAVPGGHTAILDGDGVAPWGGPGLGLIEPNPPSLGIPDEGDNLDALDMDTRLAHTAGPVFFSLDSAFIDPLEVLSVPPPNGGTAAANGFVGGDVLISTPGGAPGVYAPAALLGLDSLGADTDDLDALALLDLGTFGLFEPGIDLLWFSVRRGSLVIGMLDPVSGLLIGPGDILTYPAAPGPPTVVIPATALGLAVTPAFDDLDALDVVPEPSSLVLTALAGLGLTLYRSRRRRAT